jgi:pectate lyase
MLCDKTALFVVLAILALFASAECIAFSEEPLNYLGSDSSRLKSQQVRLLKTFGEIPVGFGRGTTGGLNGERCEVTSLEDAGVGSLRSCLEDPSPKWVVFKVRGNIHLKSTIEVEANKTVDGRGHPPITLVGETFHLLRIQTPNIIVSDLRFRKDYPKDHRCAKRKSPSNSIKGCGHGISVQGAKAQNIWINHNDFSACGGKCIGVWTGGDNITISGNLIQRSYYGTLIGVAKDVAKEDIPQMHITMYGNVFDQINRRSPRVVSGARLHFFNNVITNWGAVENNTMDFGSASSGAAHFFAENNVYEPRGIEGANKRAIIITEKLTPDKGSRGEGLVFAKDNLLMNGAQIIQRESDRVFQPSRLYRYHAYCATEKLKLLIRWEAGTRPSANPW